MSPGHPTITATAPLLVVDAVRLRAGDRLLVDNLSFALAPGQRLAVVGPNGSGKSTLLRALAGLTPTAAGRLVRPPSPPGMLFQEGALWPHLTVEGHLAFVDRGAHPEWRDHLLAALRLGSLRRSRPEQLSGGERVRLGLARALAGRPAWVLLDEPLAHLDAFFEELLRSFLPRCLDELSAAAVVVTHTADALPLLANRVLCVSGAGPWWLGDAGVALERPPTPLLAVLAGHGTVLTAVADAHGHADFGLGLHLQGQRAGAECYGYLEAAQVTLDGAADARPGVHAGVYAGADGRGGGWVAIGGQSLRCRTGSPAPAHGARVGVSVLGALRPLSHDGRAPAEAPPAAARS